jgi:group II intron reverse transcriptase/maturase
MRLVAQRVKDKRVLRLIGRYLRAGMLEGGVTSTRTEGTPQGGPLSPLLSNILLDELDQELERRGHRFVRYADDCNVYVRSRRAGERVMDSLERFLQERLRLQVNQTKRAVARPWERKFLGYSVTNHLQPKLKVAAESAKRFKANLRQMFHKGRGRSLQTIVKDLAPVIRGWMAYYRLAEVKGLFEDLDQWIRRKLRAILWRQWKHPGPRFRALLRRGLDRLTAWRTAYNQHGPWWNAGYASMHQAVPTAAMRQLGLVSLLEEHRRLACSR